MPSWLLPATHSIELGLPMKKCKILHWTLEGLASRETVKPVKLQQKYQQSFQIKNAAFLENIYMNDWFLSISFGLIKQNITKQKKKLQLGFGVQLIHIMMENVAKDKCQAAWERVRKQLLCRNDFNTTLVLLTSTLESIKCQTRYSGWNTCWCQKPSKHIITGGNYYKGLSKVFREVCFTV